MAATAWPHGGVVRPLGPVLADPAERSATIVATFADVFPHVRAFSTGLTFVLLGRMDPFPRSTSPSCVAGRRSRREGELGRDRGPRAIELLSFYQFDGRRSRPGGGTRRGAPTTGPRSSSTRRWGCSRTPWGPTSRRSPCAGVPAERGARLAWPASDASVVRGAGGAYEAVQDGEILLGPQGAERGVPEAPPAAESGQRYARYLGPISR